MTQKGWYGMIPIYKTKSLDIDGMRVEYCGRGYISKFIFKAVVWIFGFNNELIGINKNQP